MLKKLTSDELHVCCDKSAFTFKTTEELTPLTDIIGQERAVRAMEFGLKINRKGYNNGESEIKPRVSLFCIFFRRRRSVILVIIAF